MIRSAEVGDAESICEIYNHFVRESTATFEEVPVSADDMSQRIRNIRGRLPWLVLEQDGVLAGYAYAAPWMTRSAYRYSVETTIYVGPAVAGKGIGTELYRALVTDLRTRDLHCAVGIIALPNPGSVALHEKLGFRRIGQFSEIGRKFGQWIDVGYWQLLL